jgi:hypothetical protein
LTLALAHAEGMGVRPYATLRPIRWPPSGGTTVKTRPMVIAVAAALLPSAAVFGDSGDDVAALRAMVLQMKADYEARIRDLERRLAEAERRPAAAPAGPATAPAAAPVESTAGASAPLPPPATATPPVLGAIGSGTRFNPTISVILDGNYYNDDIDGRGNELLGEAFQPSRPAADDHGHDHGEVAQGFNLREAEIFLGASVDPYFDAATYLSVTGTGEVDLEEAYFQTRSLPWGLALKGGKFYSGIGYINEQHPHQWDFATQNLPYLNLLGDHGLQATGVQLTWLPEWDYYTRLGLEVLTGDQERFGAFVDDDTREALAAEAGVDSLNLSDRTGGPPLYTAFAEFSPDLGFNHELLIGGFGGYARQHQEVQELSHDEAVALTSLEGSAWLAGAELVYFYDAAGPYGQGDIKLQTEYLREMKDLDVRFDTDGVGGGRRFVTDGLYVQGRYGLAPRWQLAARYDNLGVFANRIEQDGHEVADFGSSDRWTAAITWTPTEFSRFRFEWEDASILQADGSREHFNTFWLQFLMSLGAHGAHKF